MWNMLKIMIVAVFLFQLIIVYGAESIAKETGDYGPATYEMLWLILLYFIGDSFLKEDKK